MSAPERKQRDWFDVADIVVKGLASVLLPVALFWSGHMITRQQAISAQMERKGHEKTEEMRRREERVTDLLRYLASDRAKERLLAVSVLKGISRDGELPSEMSTALVEIAMHDEDARVVKAAYGAVDAQPPRPPTDKAEVATERTGESAASHLPARLYVQIGAESQRAEAQRLEQELERSGAVVVPGIERVMKPPAESDLRYFWPEDQAEAEEIAKRLDALGAKVKVLFLRHLARSGRPRHFELWLAAPAG